MTTAEQMAIAVLKGDMTAARALADLLCDEVNIGSRVHKPNKVVGNHRHYQCIAYLKDTAENIEDKNVAYGVRISLEEWVEQGGVLMLREVDRVEIYDRLRG